MLELGFSFLVNNHAGWLWNDVSYSHLTRHFSIINFGMEGLIPPNKSVLYE
jgi:hypothetical protein